MDTRTAFSASWRSKSCKEEPGIVQPGKIKTKAIIKNEHQRQDQHTLGGGRLRW